MKLIALAALAASLLFSADDKVSKSETAPAPKIRALTSTEQLDLLGVIAEAGMLKDKAEVSEAVVAAKAAIVRQNETIDRVRLAIDCKECGFSLVGGKIAIVPPSPPQAASSKQPTPAQ